MIKNLIFDLGGVVVTLDHDEAVRRFTDMGIRDAADILNPYTQSGVFGELEEGAITASEFVDAMCEMLGRKVSYEECQKAWLGYFKMVPPHNLETLLNLRRRGYSVVLLSNTNPFVMDWCRSAEFDGNGHSLDHYFDALYTSYEAKMMKPDEAIFRHVLMNERMLPDETLFIDDGPRNCAAASQLGIHTFCPVNGEDWTADLYALLDGEGVKL